MRGSGRHSPTENRPVLVAELHVAAEVWVEDPGGDNLDRLQESVDRFFPWPSVLAIFWPECGMTSFLLQAPCDSCARSARIFGQKSEMRWSGISAMSPGKSVEVVSSGCGGSANRSTGSGWEK